MQKMTLIPNLTSELKSNIVVLSYRHSLILARLSVQVLSGGYDQVGDKIIFFFVFPKCNR